MPQINATMKPVPTPHKASTVTIESTDADSGAALDGRVLINNVDVAATNTPFTYLFRGRVARRVEELSGDDDGEHLHPHPRTITRTVWEWTDDVEVTVAGYPNFTVAIDEVPYVQKPAPEPVLDRLYTTSQAERDTAILNLHYDIEEIACWVLTDPATVPSSIPLYRSYDPQQRHYLYTANHAEHLDAVNNQHYIDLGIACYVLTDGDAAGVPFYRTLDHETGVWLYTTSRDDAGPAASKVCFVYAERAPGRSPLYHLSLPTAPTPLLQSGIEWFNYPDTIRFTPQRWWQPRHIDHLVAIVRAAEASGKHVHAYGRGMSFSGCAITDEYLVATSWFERPLQTVQRALKDPGRASTLFHVEAGITLQALNDTLWRQHLALETMGGQTGQALAGAFSTGTHGGDQFIPPLADSVVAIHLVGAKGTQYWIEPSDGITDPNLLMTHVAPEIEPQNIIYDDKTFNACLVSLGCMGVIYAVVLRVRSPYDLIEYTTPSLWQNFKADVAHLSMEPGTRFLQVVVDPYTNPDTAENNFCLVMTRREVAPTGERGQPRPEGKPEDAVRDMIIDCLGLLTAWYEGQLHSTFDNTENVSQQQLLTKIVRALLLWDVDTGDPGVSRNVDEIRRMRVATMGRHYRDLIQAGWPPGQFQAPSYAVMDNSYWSGKPRPVKEPGHSIELFFDATQRGYMAFVDFVIATVRAAQDTFFAGYISLRFMGRTRATLGMQQWDKTCSVEVAVLQNLPGLPEMLSQFLARGLALGGLPHWGQELPQGVDGSIHGQRYVEWREVYAKLSDGFSARTFQNKVSNDWKLTAPL